MTTTAIPQHRGPNLTAVASVFAALFVASLVVTAVLSGGGHIPSPWDAEARKFLDANALALRISGFLQFGAMIPLAIYSASVESRLRFLGVRAAGPTLALAGGLLAALMIGLSGLAQWMLVQPGLSEHMRLLHVFAFATGGPGHVVPFGILIAGIAISGGLSNHLSRGWMWVGVAIALIAELSSLTLLVQPAAYLLPVARFLGLIWLIGAARQLPRGR